MFGKRYTVFAIHIETGAKRVIAEKRSKDDAERIRNESAARQKIDDEYFDIEPTKGDAEYEHGDG